MTTHDLPTGGTLEISVERIDGVVVLSVKGELDMVSTPYLTEAIDVVLAEASPSAVIVDLTDVPFLASIGMTVLVETHRRVSEFSDFAVVAAGPTTARPLTLMGLNETFSMYTDRDAALAAVRP
ncbi:MAG: STAS domain-containing protein [Rhodococcus sp. (in: high G+C Gram-positive bacteria)]